MTSIFFQLHTYVLPYCRGILMSLTARSLKCRMSSEKLYILFYARKPVPRISSTSRIPATILVPRLQRS